MDKNEFVDEVLSQFHRDLTDAVFLYIQHDRALMEGYLGLVHSHKKKNTLNQQIGKAVKARYGLKDAPTRDENPHSTLIKSHQEYA